MRKRTISINLSSGSISNAIYELEKYKNDMNRKTKLFLEKLADIGITVAKNKAQGDSHHFDEMVEFVKEWKDGELYLIGRNSNLSGLHIEWYDGEGQYHDETISPILALEYGTGKLAIEGHKGSFAVTGNHVDDDVWYYYQSLDENGKPTDKHPATPEEPHQMMYEATMEMMRQIITIAKEVWSDE